MKKKLVVLLLLSLAITTFSACGKKEENKKNSTSIELEISEPESIELGTHEELVWTELGSLNDVPQLRAAWDKIFKTKGALGKREGTIYLQGDDKYYNNNTIAIAAKNADFTKIADNNKAKLGEAGELEYTDISDEDDDIKFLMALNGYFNIIQDGENPDSANPYETLTRAQVMSAVMRATTPVDSKLTVDEKFEKAVGESDYNLYAQQMNTAYLNIENGLDKDAYNSKMTRGEALYLVMNTFFSEDLLIIQGSEVETREDCADAGDLIESKGNAKEALKEMIANPETGADTKLANAVFKAGVSQLYVGESRWDEAITKSELIDIIYKAARHSQNIKSFQKEGYAKEYNSDGSVLENEEKWNESFEIWEKYCSPENWGVATKGMTSEDITSKMPTLMVDNYPANEDLKIGTTTKGYKCVYSISRKEVYYSGMILPMGMSWYGDKKTDDKLMDYFLSHDEYDTTFDIPYKTLKKLFGDIDMSKGLKDERW